MKKKTICTITSLTLALLLLAGCAGENPPEPSQTPSDPPEQSQAVESAPSPALTATPEPTDTPESSEAPEPSAEAPATPEPTAAPTPAPTSAPTATPTPTPAPQGPEDGNYTAKVTLSGGTGRASIQSPAQLRCSNGQFYATILWSSPNFDYMKVNGVRYDLLSQPGANSTFEIPVAAFDTPLAVIADTLAMSEPHEVEYILTFDSASLAKQ